MQTFVQNLRSQLTAVICSMLLLAGPPGATAQDPVTQQTNAPEAEMPKIPTDQLDSLVAAIALHPDPLLAQVLAASTYPNQIPDAAQWAAQHSYLTGDTLARSIAEDSLPWDPSVQALLPFPSVLDTMARDLNWTTQLGNAFLAQQADVMDAVQRMRR